MNLSTVRQTEAQELEYMIYKYQDYESRGFLILSVTLATRVKSDAFAHSYCFSPIWTKYFLEKVYKRLPKRFSPTVLDHNYTIECSDQRCLQDDGKGRPLIRPGFWHVHGVIAVHPCVSRLYWKNGQLNHHLYRDICSFQSLGKYRPCRVTDFLIEPADNVEDWIRYINKTRQQKVPTI